MSQFQFASIGSGSKGNSQLVKVDDTLIMIDCGFSQRDVVRRLNDLGHSVDDITAILVTHEHSDHLNGVMPLSKKYQIPAYLTAGTYREAIRRFPKKSFHQHDIISPHASFEIGQVTVNPYPVPHDANEPCQFVFSNSANKRLGILTDVGSITPHVVEQLYRCDALMLECNYEPELLQSGPYPPSLKRRIDGRLGHLANAQASELLGQIDCSGLQHVVGMHVSEKNNLPELAFDALTKQGLLASADVHVANQDEGFGWRSIV